VLSKKEHRLLRETALRTWKYFATFSTAANHWLIPDNVQEEPYRVAERISPTNLGLLLNARQAALEFGYLTLAEFISLTEKTLETSEKLPRFHGHFVNWYDTTTLEPLAPLTISSVDDGNFIASLWSLREGCLELLERPVILPSALEGLADYAANEKLDDSWRKLFRLKEPQEWLPLLLAQPDSAGSTAFQERLRALKTVALDLRPQDDGAFPKTLPTPGESLAARLRAIAAQCERLSEQMDFSFLINQRRKLMSIGYDAGKEKLNDSCYDLLASEARIAAFVAVAKDETSQESWFRLGRQHTVCEGEFVLISWTGTMFEYLMPLIWMRSHPDTLLARSLDAAVRAQQNYGRRRGIPWGISESAYAKTDEQGNYQYAAFGVPGLALNVARAGFLVVAPYASCLALMVDLSGSVRNLAKMSRKGWLGEYGFFEAADYTASTGGAFRSRKYELVRCFMAHHQGMTLTAICNVLYENPFQRWFHAATLVQASELILNERPLRVRPVTDLQPRRVVNFDTPHAPAV
jgi:hypothetical protein